MKNSLKSFVALAFAGLFAIAAQAQSTPKVLIVDMAKLYDGHHKTIEQNEKLKEDQQKAESQLQALNNEGNDLVKEFNELKEQLNNPTLSADGKAKTQQELEAKGQEIQRKQNEVNTFRANTQRALQQRINSFKQYLLEDISKIAVDIAKKKGATLLLDKSGPTLIGLSSVLYHDASYDITEEVATELNRDRPAGSSSASNDQPTVTFPGVAK